MPHHTSHPRPFRLSTAVVSIAGCLTLAGCNLFGNGNDNGVADGTDAEDRTGGSITVQVTNFAHIDPQSITFGMWLVQMGLLEGLLLQTTDGTDVRPGIAEEWEVSEDGLTYTFHLRAATWSDGTSVTAAHFVDSYQRLLDPERGTAGSVVVGDNSYQEPMGIVNATAYNTGAVEDFEEVGVEAIDESTLEFTLEAANPGFLMGLTHPSMLPLNPDAFEGEGDWQQPENWVGNGPYNLVDWVPNSSMRLERNPEYWDNENVALDSIDIQLIESGSITTTVPYENEEVDIQALIEPAEVTRFMNDPELSDHINRLESTGSRFLMPMHSENTVLEDPEVRSALNLALGREEIAGLSPISEPASTLVFPTTPGWDESMAAHDQMWGDEAVAEAQRLLAEAGYPDGDDFPTLTLLAASDFPELDAIVDTWERNLNIDVVKEVVDVGIYIEAREEVHDEDYVGFRFASYGGVSTWPYQTEAIWNRNDIRDAGLSVDAFADRLQILEDEQLSQDERATALEELRQEETSPLARDFADRVLDVAETTDEAEQQEILRDAAAIREEGEFYLPVHWTSTFYIAQPRVQGLELRAQAERYYFKDLWVDDNAN